jgi:helix-turn-helix protein/GAF domain-containing protein
MTESFGARLRQQRERQEISLVTIADQTKIKLSLLEALERDDVSHWPAGIFRRAFIRAYGHAIGLNPDVVVREFLEVHPDPIEVVALDAIATVVDGARTSAGPPTRLRYLVGSAIGSLSRLRGSPVVEEPGVAAGAVASVPSAPAPSEPDLSAPAQPSTEPGVAKAARHEDSFGLKAEATRLQTDRVDSTNKVVADSAPVNEPATYEPDLLAAAQLCTEFGRVENTDDVQPLLHEAARILDALGLIVWVWDPMAAELWPALAYGYSDKVLAQLPTVRRDTDNATAAAFRSAQTCAISGSDHASGALVAPLLTPAGCAGVLAIELPHGSEQTNSVRAVATIFAAQLAQLVGGAPPAAVRPQADSIVPPGGDLATSMFCANLRR